MPQEDIVEGDELHKGGLGNKEGEGARPMPTSPSLQWSVAGTSKVTTNAYNVSLPITKVLFFRKITPFLSLFPFFCSQRERKNSRSRSLSLGGDRLSYMSRSDSASLSATDKDNPKLDNVMTSPSWSQARSWKRREGGGGGGGGEGEDRFTTAAGKRGKGHLRVLSDTRVCFDDEEESASSSTPAIGHHTGDRDASADLEGGEDSRATKKANRRTFGDIYRIVKSSSDSGKRGKAEGSANSQTVLWRGNERLNSGGGEIQEENNHMESDRITAEPNRTPMHRRVFSGGCLDGLGIDEEGQSAYPGEKIVRIKSKSDCDEDEEDEDTEGEESREREDDGDADEEKDGDSEGRKTSRRPHGLSYLSTINKRKSRLKKRVHSLYVPHSRYKLPIFCSIHRLRASS